MRVKRMRRKLKRKIINTAECVFTFPMMVLSLVGIALTLIMLPVLYKELQRSSDIPDDEWDLEDLEIDEDGFVDELN